MFEWLAANLATIIVALIVLAVAALIVRQMVRDKKRGKGGCSCGRDCRACGACHQAAPGGRARASARERS